MLRPLRFAIPPLTALASLLSAPTVSAQATATNDQFKAEEVGAQRVLSGHYFLPSNLVPWPFATTHFDADVALGYGSGIFVNADGDRFDLSVASFTNALELQLAFADFIAIRGQLGAQMLGGTNEDAALYFGASFGYQLGGGLTLTYRLTDWLQVSLLGDVSSGPAYNLNLFNAIVNFAETGNISVGSGFSESSQTEVGGDLVVALGVGPTLGIYVSGGYGSTIASDESEGFGRLAVAASLDLEEATQVPLGALGGYRIEFLDGGGNTHGGSLGLFYTGRRSLALGIEGALFDEPSGGGERFSTAQAVIAVRYFW